tara:strand:- start:47 stop:1672 length:1626 start_codon:yes stop_codon:yes gene_type:complete
MELDYGDLKFFGEPASSFESLNPSQLAGRQSAASRYLQDKNKKNLTGLQATTGLNRRVLLGGDPYILAVRKGKVIPIPYEKYMSSLTSAFKIPPDLITAIRSLEGLPNIPTTQQVPYGKPNSKGVQKTRTVTAKQVLQPGTADNFLKWHREFIAGQKGEQSFFRKLGKAFEEANLEDAAVPGKKVTDVDISHTYPRSLGGRFTFLEAWFANQARGAKEFIPKEILQEAGLPIDYTDLFNAWQLQRDGMPSSLGNLETIEIDDIFALSRKEDVNKVFTRRERINNIRELAEADPDTNIPLYKDEYRRLKFESRGSKGTDKDLINLAEDMGYVLDPTKRTGRYIKVGENRVSKFERATGMPGVDDLEPALDKGGWKKAGIAGTGLTISGLAGEAGFAALNPETGFHAGKLASGEGDMSNVTGAVKGIGQDLVGGGITTGGLKGAQFGWKKAMQMAGKRGATHFAGKGAVGKLGARLVPYAGTALLAYSLYDTADAFTEGLTGKGITERIKEVDYEGIINDVYSDNNSIFRRGKEQDTTNLTTM